MSEYNTTPDDYIPKPDDTTEDVPDDTQDSTLDSTDSSLYLTYQEYTAMGGTLDKSAFNDFAFEAESTINWYTFNRLTKETSVSDNVKRLMYRLIGLIQLSQKAQSLGQDTKTGEIAGAISNQSNDGFSTSYNVLTASDAVRISDAETKRLVRQYLGAETNSLGHKLLYRGVYPDE